MKRHRTIDALVGWFVDRGHHPVATLVFEDVQWIDPTSKLLLGRLATWAKHTCVLIIVTLRADSLDDAHRIFGDASLSGRQRDPQPCHRPGNTRAGCF